MKKQSWISADSANLAWLVLAILIFLYVLAYDLWAYYTGHKMMTTQFRNWLTDPIAGPIAAALWVGTFVGLTFHFLVKSSKK